MIFSIPCKPINQHLKTIDNFIIFSNFYPFFFVYFLPVFHYDLVLCLLTVSNILCNLYSSYPALPPRLVDKLVWQILILFFWEINSKIISLQFPGSLLQFNIITSSEQPPVLPVSHGAFKLINYYS